MKKVLLGLLTVAAVTLTYGPAQADSCMDKIQELEMQTPNLGKKFAALARELARAEGMKQGYGVNVKLEKWGAADYLCNGAGNILGWHAKYKVGNENSYIRFTIKFNPYTQKLEGIEPYSYN